MEKKIQESDLNESNPGIAQGPEKLSKSDLLTLELAKLNRKLTASEVEKAIAHNETSELSYKYVLLQIQMKYKLSGLDSLQEDGTITRQTIAD